MRLYPQSPSPIGLSKPAVWSRALLIALIATASGYSADLAKWSFSALTGTSANAPVTSIDTSVQSASPITRGGGLTAGSFTAALSSSAWTTSTSFDAGDYYEFTITPGAGNILNIDTLSFAEGRSSTGIRNFELRSSLDSYATTVGTACPYCLVMLDDASKSDASDVRVADVATLLAESVLDPD